MYLCLDVGNSQIFGGVFNGDELLLRFRHETPRTATSDQLGVFLRNVLRESDIDPEKISRVAISSVVPPIDYSLGSACIKYFKQEPFWVKAGIKTGLKLKVKHANEVGADLITAAIAATTKFERKNLLIVDLGTASTYIAVSKNKEFLGAVFQAGIRTSMQALQNATEQLPTVQIVEPDSVLGRDTVSSIQSGLYYGQLGAMKALISGICEEAFSGQDVMVIGTGGFSTLFERSGLFDTIQSDLVLYGIKQALVLNL